VTTAVRPRYALVLVCVAAFLVYLDTSITPVAVPAIDAELDAGPTAAQWLLDAYVLAFACLLLTAGSLGDRIGRRPVLVGGVAGFTVASVICALAPDAATLIAGRAAQGVFAAAVVPLSLAVAAASAPDAAGRARAIGVWGGTCGVALALGPLVGGLLVETLGWRAVFWINLPIGVLAAAGLLRSVPAQASATGRRPDVLGQVLFLVGGVGLTFALIEGPVLGWGSVPVLGLLVAGALAWVLFAGWQSRAAAPMLPPRLLAIPEVGLACAVNFLGLFGLYAALYLVTVHLQTGLGFSPLETGVRFVALFGALGLAAVLASRVVARWGTRATMVAGLGCVAVGLIGLTLLAAGVGYAGYVWALVLLGVGVPLSSGVVAIQAMMGAVPAELAATASGAMNTFRQFGAVFGVALAGILSPVRDGVVTAMHVTFLVAGGAALAAAVLTAVVLRPTPIAAPPRARPA
jgi:DHA2 family methylenomycin A resistance protein-like MFS transporter